MTLGTELGTELGTGLRTALRTELGTELGLLLRKVEDDEEVGASLGLSAELTPVFAKFASEDCLSFTILSPIDTATTMIAAHAP
eukprot:CAMPEP_0194083126 /NCGR_PEP_ID=MMETSP0149-20130528/8464_1 /TAXON_ID=122233 /ORGANISM="Chaetoceros debilis, Strain MM31A-1" /LENGTH=83 /DNA_ID=CAMNT_0038765463 /DNA_START=8 /DNA_END=255 /DNA_ORIENTATION=-